MDRLPNWRQHFADVLRELGVPVDRIPADYEVLSVTANSDEEMTFAWAWTYVYDESGHVMEEPGTCGLLRKGPGGHVTFRLAELDTGGVGDGE